MEKERIGTFVCALTVMSCTAVAFGNGWTKASKEPVFGSPELGTCFDVNVITEGPKKFNMYFSWRARQAIARTTSDDGVNWSAPEVCLEPDAASGWEDKLNRSGTVYWNGEYHLWYTGQARGFSRIGYAKSKDGVNFVRVTRQPVLIPERPHEGFSVMNPYVMRDAARGVWRMWYASGETYEPNVICYAESADGVRWEKSPLNPVFVKGDGGAWDRDRVGGCEVHRLKDGRYVMFYIGYSDVHTARIGAAVSPDGITRWERLAANPLVVPTPDGWDASAVYKPSVSWDAEADCWRLWYNGRRGPNEFVGMAVHPGYDLGSVASSPFKVLPAEIVRRHFDRFSFDDEETVRTAISNQGSGWWANAAIPRFDCPDADVVRTYYFRWWTYRKHLRRAKDGRWVVTEFLPDVGWAGAENTISCPLNHHLAEGRWLRRPEYLDGYLPFMMERGSMSGPRAYAAAPAWGALERVRVTGDWTQAKALLAAFARNYAAWEAGWDRKSLSLADSGVSCVRPIRGVPFRVGYRAERGLFDCPGDREGAEFALSADGARPLVNALMWAEASAIAEIARAAGDAATAGRFTAKAASLEQNVKARLWNPGRAFFTALAADGAQDGVCELTGYAPFAVGMPLAGFGAAWRGIVDERGFLAPKGLVFPRRDTPGFAPGAVDAARHECLWNGPSWPYATSVALAGLARALHGGLEMPVDREDFARLMALYARQHVRVREDGRAVPWIDENLSGFTGEWLARDILLAQAKAEGRKPAYHERGKDYNHSTFCDLVITGLCGLVPQTDGALRVDPLAPAAWDWWCLDGVRYHGRDVTVLFDRDGTHYGRGQGLVILDPKGKE